MNGHVAPDASSGVAREARHEERRRVLLTLTAVPLDGCDTRNFAPRDGRGARPYTTMMWRRNE